MSSLINTSSFQTTKTYVPAAAVIESNVLSATGLPRAVLAAMFRRDGLFGRDSDLSHAEQAVLQSRLPRIDGMTRLSVPTFLSSRQKALSDYADALVEGRNAEAERRQLVREGFNTAAISEVGIVVGNVRTVFGAFSIKALATTSNAAPSHHYAKAA